MKVSYALKLLREYIIWPQMKFPDFYLIVTNKKCVQKYRKLDLRWPTASSISDCFATLHFLPLLPFLPPFATFCLFFPLFATFFHFLPI